MNAIQVLGTGRYLPPQVVTNQDFCSFIDTSDEWVVSRTGIQTRHIADGEACWQMAAKAAKAALEQAQLPAEAVDMLIVSSVTPEFYTPSASCLVQGEIGAVNAFSIDINCACSGFTYGVDMARRYLATGDVKTVLVVSSEKLSNITDYTDRSTCVLFGDGAGACVLQAGDGMYASFLGCDASGANTLYAPHATHSCRFEANPPALPQGFADTPAGYLQMAGREVYKFAVHAMPHAVQQACARAGITPEQLDWIIPHQANIRIIQTAMKNLGLPMEKAMVNLQHYANTSSATIPIALDEANRAGLLHRGDKVALVGFGAGLTYGAVVFTW